jgi:hypothetical protein
MFDNLKDKAAELIGQNPEKVEELSDQAIDKAGDVADSMTGGKFSEQIDAAQEKADEAVGE